MPAAYATGARIGTSTITPGSGSIKMPKISSSTLISSSNASGPTSSDVIQRASDCGTFSIVNTHANAALAATISNTDALRMAERDRIAGTFFQCSER